MPMKLTMRAGCADGRCIIWNFGKLVKESDVTAEDDEVDILTMEKDDFSDSDMSQEELCYLPITPSPDKCAGTSSKLIDNNHSGSPCSVEAGQNNHGMNHASSPLAVGSIQYEVFGAFQA
ncbi:transducin family protein [Tripterygium wilfordii]|uniref:Transducin family protein n=1 Tax=Tripterygium wilfordii TaxID=458696 RepID=A0A7J7BZ23_TRIWF|nr:transducin family protein [Tripterygium wilfordii]